MAELRRASRATGAHVWKGSPSWERARSPRFSRTHARCRRSDCRHDLRDVDRALACRRARAAAAYGVDAILSACARGIHERACAAAAATTCAAAGAPRGLVPPASPCRRADFAFIYSIFDPADAASERHGVGVQIIGPDDTRVERRAGRRLLGRRARARARPHDARHTAAEAVFAGRVRAVCRGGLPVHLDAPPGRVRRRELVVRGDAAARLGRRRRSAVLDGERARRGAVFDPHYQVLMAHGRASGHVCWRGERYDFDDAIVYSEKNWRASSRRALVLDGVQHGLVGSGRNHADGGGRAARGARRRRGGRRDDRSAHGSRPGRRDGQVPAVPQRRVADGPMGPVARASGEFDGLKCLVEATADDAGVSVRVPTAAGMVEGSRESFAGALRVRVWRDGEQDAPLIDARARAPRSSSAVRRGTRRGWGRARCAAPRARCSARTCRSTPCASGSPGSDLRSLTVVLGDVKPYARGGRQTHVGSGLTVSTRFFLSNLHATSAS